MTPAAGSAAPRETGETIGRKQHDPGDRNKRSRERGRPNGFSAFAVPSVATVETAAPTRDIDHRAWRPGR